MLFELNKGLPNAANGRNNRAVMAPFAMKWAVQLLPAVIGLTLVLPATAAETATVLQVLDGDTCQLDDGRHVRYLGIDAPEKDDPNSEDATRANNQLVGGKNVRLEIGKPDRDRDGRLLAYVFVGTNFVNAELVRLGHAWVRRPVMRKYNAALLKAQEEARAAGRGMWANATNRHLAVVKVHARPAAGGRRDLNDEYIELKNQGDVAVTFTGWTVEDEGHHRYLFPAFVLKAGGRVTLRTGLGKNAENELFWGSSRAIWNDNGDTVFIRDASGNLVLVHVY